MAKHFMIFIGLFLSLLRLLSDANFAEPCMRSGCFYPNLSPAPGLSQRRVRKVG
jgi:hypothetical protein